MTERRKLELPLNQPTPVELLYDEPVVGKNQYGNYYLYAIKSGKEEYSFFAPEEIHNSLQNLRRGDTATLTKVAEQKGTKVLTRYQVNTDKKLPVTNKESQKEQSINNGDPYYEVMLKCYQDALKIQENLNGLVDVNRISITLFIARSKLPFNINGNSN